MFADFSGTDSDADYIPNTDEQNISSSDSRNRIRRAVIISESSSSSSSDEDQRQEEDIILEMGIGSRKRQVRKDTWKRTLKKIKVNSGMAYTSRLGKEHRAKSLQNPCNSNCKLKCTENISEVQRKGLIESFYNLADKVRQRDYLSRCMKAVVPKRTRINDAKRKQNMAYYFQIDLKNIRVCKKFFTATLDISNNSLSTTIRKTKNGIVEGEKRGCIDSVNKTKDYLIMEVKNHINSFPRLPSHYSRARTNKSYIDGSLNITLMYNFYKENCIKDGKQFVSKAVYSNIFNTEFNISFFMPKKDLCNFCTEYNNYTDDERMLKKQEYEDHKTDISLSRQMKEADKRNTSPDKILAIYDLQAILQLPNGNMSALFYKSKLNCFNFTIFEAKTLQGYCHFWTEAIAKRGAQEITTCVYNYLIEYCQNKHVIFYSDNCTAQNKNKFLASMYIYVVATTNVQSITHKYLVTGHTNNEGDSMHACIEKEKKRILRQGPIFIPAELVTVMKTSKKTGKPYIVKEYQTEDFLDWKKASENIGKNYNIDDVGTKCSWNQFKMIKISKQEPDKIYYKYNYNDDDFERFIDVKHKMRGRRPEISNLILEKAYTVPPPIPQNKKNDLMSLCQSRIIPERHHNFYYNIKSSNSEETPSA